MKLTGNLTTLVTEHEATNRGHETEEDGQKGDLGWLCRQLRHAFWIDLLQFGGIGGVGCVSLTEETHDDRVKDRTTGRIQQRWSRIGSRCHSKEMR